MKNSKKLYEPPVVEILKVEVENGFAVSGNTTIADWENEDF